MLSVRQAADILEMTVSMVEYLCRRGKLKGTKDQAGNWKFKPRDLLLYISQTKLITCASIAKKMNCSVRTVQNCCRQLGIPQFAPRRYLLDEEMAKLVMDNIFPGRGRPLGPYKGRSSRSEPKVPPSKSSRSSASPKK